MELIYSCRSVHKLHKLGVDNRLSFALKWKFSDQNAWSGAFFGMSSIYVHERENDEEEQGMSTWKTEHELVCSEWKFKRSRSSTQTCEGVFFSLCPVRERHLANRDVHVHFTLYTLDWCNVIVLAMCPPVRIRFYFLLRTCVSACVWVFVWMQFF